MKTKFLIDNLKIEKIYVAHSTSLNINDVALPASDKINDYISRREKKDLAIETIAYEIAGKNHSKFTAD